VKRELGLDAANAVNGGEQLANHVMLRLEKWGVKSAQCVSGV